MYKTALHNKSTQPRMSTVPRLRKSSSRKCVLLFCGCFHDNLIITLVFSILTNVPRFKKNVAFLYPVLQRRSLNFSDLSFLNQIWQVFFFLPLFLQIFYAPFIFLLSSWESNYTYARLLDIVPLIPEGLFIGFQPLPLCSSDQIVSLDLSMLTEPFSLPFSNLPLSPNSVFFSQIPYVSILEILYFFFRMYFS